jgi:hypothetical protein
VPKPIVLESMGIAESTLSGTGDRWVSLTLYPSYNPWIHEFACRNRRHTVGWVALRLSSILTIICLLSVTVI